MKRILITGCSGYLGSMVVRLLAERGGWEIFGIDVQRPQDESAYAGFAQASVTDSRAMAAIFEQARPDVAVHLAFVVDVTHNPRREEDIAIGGTRNFLEGVRQSGAPKAVLVTSVAAYGAHEDNDVPLTESSPIRGNAGYSYSRLKAAVDDIARAFMNDHQECEFAILRPCLFVGAHTRNHFFDLLKFPIVPRVMDFKGVRDPLFQFIHEDDMARCLVAAIEKPARGIYNVAAEGEQPFSKLVRLTGKRSLPLPWFLLYPATALLWALRLVTSPPAQLYFIRYPWIMDVSRMRRDLYVPVMNGIDAFKEFVEKQINKDSNIRKENMRLGVID